MSALIEVAKKADEQISAIHKAFGAPGDHGYESREGKALYELYKFQVELRAAINAPSQTPLLQQPQYIIEGIILRRLHEKRIEGYTIEMAKEIVAATAPAQRAPYDPFNRRQVEAICRAVCGVEGVDPDSDVYGDGCDPQWSRYADAVASALTSTDGGAK